MQCSVTNNDILTKTDFFCQHLEQFLADVGLIFDTTRFVCTIAIRQPRAENYGESLVRNCIHHTNKQQVDQLVKLDTFPS